MKKGLLIGIVSLVVLCIVGQAWYFWYVSTPPPFTKNAPLKEIEVKRLQHNPIIYHTMDASLREEVRQYGYANINGPAMIKVPSWVKNPLGKYYLYFAHHKGDYIKLAYADKPEGPWRIYPAGALHVQDSLFATTPPDSSKLTAMKGLWKRMSATEFWTLLRVGLAARKASREMKEKGMAVSGEEKPHIASPDVYVDNEKQEIRMYYHGLLDDAVQASRVAVSSDGIHFQSRKDVISAPYLRVFLYRGIYYGIAMPGLLYRSQDGLNGFEVRSQPLAGTNMRHLALLLRGETLFVFWTRVGDAPESILCSTIDLRSNNWKDWKLSEPVEVLRPDMPWEGGDLTIEPSVRTEITVRKRQLRDPAIFQDQDQNKIYLLYSVAGEHALAIAELKIKD
jgi:hypothetical protein